MLDQEQLARLRKAGRVASQARDIGISMVGEGVRLLDVAQEVESYIRSHGCGLAFPCNLGINEVAAHYTPCMGDKLTFKRGDVVKVDCGAEIDGYVGDTAATVEVGTNRHKALIEASAGAREAVASFIAAGVKLKDIGGTVETVIRSKGFKPIENLCGHEIKPYNLHAGLSVPSYDNGSNSALTAGMMVAVEPFATTGIGIVDDGPPGNIVRIIRERRLADPKATEFYQYCKGEFKSFPFCARSCDFPDAERHMRTLVRHGVVTSYSQMIEARKGMVSQHEYTFYIGEGKSEVTTVIRDD